MENIVDLLEEERRLERMLTAGLAKTARTKKALADALSEINRMIIGDPEKSIKAA